MAVIFGLVALVIVTFVFVLILIVMMAVFILVLIVMMTFVLLLGLFPVLMPCTGTGTAGSHGDAHRGRQQI